MTDESKTVKLYKIIKIIRIMIIKKSNSTIVIIDYQYLINIIINNINLNSISTIKIINSIKIIFTLRINFFNFVNN